MIHITLLMLKLYSDEARRIAVQVGVEVPPKYVDIITISHSRGSI